MENLASYHQTVAFYFILVGIACFLVLLFVVDAPYGKFQNSALSIFPLPPKIGWIFLEFPALVVPPSFYFFGKPELTTNNLFGTLVIILWMIHYVHRTLIYPFLLAPSSANKKTMSILIIFGGFLFQSVNCYLLGVDLYFLREKTEIFLSSPSAKNQNFSTLFRFSVGIFLFIYGMYINIQSDSILRSLKSKNTTKKSEKKKNDDGETSSENKGYVIPRGGMFEYVSCANYYGEIVEWLGFTILTWSFASLVFFVWTLANLFPRAISSHHWYKKAFGNSYPKDRKAVFPFLC